MKRINIVIVIVLIFCCIFTGCSVVDKLQADRCADKTQGKILESDARQFVFEDNTYTILNETVERDNISVWIGITGNTCFLNKDYEILKIYDNLSYKDYLTEITKEIPAEAYYTAQFENIYRLTDNRIAIGVDGEFHVAKPSDYLSTEDTIIEFGTLNSDGDDETNFCINSENAGQLLHGEIVYRITETSLSREDKGKLLQVMGTQVVFDAESGQVIPESEAVIVEINSKLMRAEPEK
ncbi:NisI/SpaI family lantibiotic immunity lipoprotein [Marinisporobacter balticus]|uniref:Lantibiotic immunity protein Spa1 C-terminal domain-containing protein n=1 Tax=Marinisporobacter balticus TaxID=2018667 RepID=A0A4R2KFF8_9FIRM|nr:NisI/SpaI family lantibiotic immunity lipoprotein [Marinisporobacter balticus]TCO68688.1 hypothetical protein EV214_14211 [Marinisporobacter balticus]